MKKLSAGFTLIEILVAMTIVAVLTSLSLVSLQGSRKVARDGKRKADLEQIRSALEIYRSEVKAYPPSLENLVGVYMDEVPGDPVSGNSYVYNPISANSYLLCSYLETNQGPDYDSDCGGTCGSHCYYKVTNY